MASCTSGKNDGVAEKCECCKRTFALIKEFLKIEKGRCINCTRHVCASCIRKRYGYCRKCDIWLNNKLERKNFEKLADEVINKILYSLDVEVKVSVATGREMCIYLIKLYLAQLKQAESLELCKKQTGECLTTNLQDIEHQDLKQHTRSSPLKSEERIDKEKDNDTGAVTKIRKRFETSNPSLVTQKESIFVTGDKQHKSQKPELKEGELEMSQTDKTMYITIKDENTSNQLTVKKLPDTRQHLKLDVKPSTEDIAGRVEFLEKWGKINKKYEAYSNESNDSEEHNICKDKHHLVKEDEKPQKFVTELSIELHNDGNSSDTSNEETSSKSSSDKVQLRRSNPAYDAEQILRWSISTSEREENKILLEKMLQNAQQQLGDGNLTSNDNIIKLIPEENSIREKEIDSSKKDKPKREVEELPKKKKPSINSNSASVDENGNLIVPRTKAVKLARKKSSSASSSSSSSFSSSTSSSSNSSSSCSSENESSHSHKKQEIRDPTNVARQRSSNNGDGTDGKRNDDQLILNTGQVNNRSNSNSEAEDEHKKMHSKKKSKKDKKMHSKKGNKKDKTSIKNSNKEKSEKESLVENSLDLNEVRIPSIISVNEDKSNNVTEGIVLQEINPNTTERRRSRTSNASSSDDEDSNLLETSTDLKESGAIITQNQNKKLSSEDKKVGIDGSSSSEDDEMHKDMKAKIEVKVVDSSKTTSNHEETQKQEIIKETIEDKATVASSESSGSEDEAELSPKTSIAMNTHKYSRSNSCENHMEGEITEIQELLTTDKKIDSEARSSSEDEDKQTENYIKKDNSTTTSYHINQETKAISRSSSVSSDEEAVQQLQKEVDGDYDINKHDELTKIDKRIDAATSSSNEDEENKKHREDKTPATLFIEMNIGNSTKQEFTKKPTKSTSSSSDEEAGKVDLRDGGQSSENAKLNDEVDKSTKSKSIGKRIKDKFKRIKRRKKSSSSSSDNELENLVIKEEIESKLVNDEEEFMTQGLNVEAMEKVIEIAPKTKNEMSLISFEEPMSNVINMNENAKPMENAEDKKLMVERENEKTEQECENEFENPLTNELKSDSTSSTVKDDHEEQPSSKVPTEIKAISRSSSLSSDGAADQLQKMEADRDEDARKHEVLATTNKLKEDTSSNSEDQEKLKHKEDYKTAATCCNNTDLEISPLQEFRIKLTETKAFRRSSSSSSDEEADQLQKKDDEMDNISQHEKFSTTDKKVQVDASSSSDDEDKQNDKEDDMKAIALHINMDIENVTKQGFSNGSTEIKTIITSSSSSSDDEVDHSEKKSSIPSEKKIQKLSKSSISEDDMDGQITILKKMSAKQKSVEINDNSSSEDDDEHKDKQVSEDGATIVIHEKSSTTDKMVEVDVSSSSDDEDKQNDKEDDMKAIALHINMDIENATKQGFSNGFTKIKTISTSSSSSSDDEADHSEKKSIIPSEKKIQKLSKSSISEDDMDFQITMLKEMPAKEESVEINDNSSSEDDNEHKDKQLSEDGVAMVIHIGTDEKNVPIHGFNKISSETKERSKSSSSSGDEDGDRLQKKLTISLEKDVNKTSRSCIREDDMDGHISISKEMPASHKTVESETSSSSEDEDKQKDKINSKEVKPSEVIIDNTEWEISVDLGKASQSNVITNNEIVNIVSPSSHEGNDATMPKVEDEKRPKEKNAIKIKTSKSSSSSDDEHKEKDDKLSKNEKPKDEVDKGEKKGKKSIGKRIKDKFKKIKKHKKDSSSSSEDESENLKIKDEIESKPSKDQNEFKIHGVNEEVMEKVEEKSLKTENEISLISFDESLSNPINMNENVKAKENVTNGKSKEEMINEFEKQIPVKLKSSSTSSSSEDEKEQPNIKEQGKNTTKEEEIEIKLKALDDLSSMIPDVPRILITQPSIIDVQDIVNELPITKTVSEIHNIETTPIARKYTPITNQDMLEKLLEEEILKPLPYFNQERVESRNEQTSIEVQTLETISKKKSDKNKGSQQERSSISSTSSSDDSSDDDAFFSAQESDVESNVVSRRETFSSQSIQSVQREINPGDEKTVILKKVRPKSVSEIFQRKSTTGMSDISSTSSTSTRVTFHEVKSVRVQNSTEVSEVAENVNDGVIMWEDIKRLDGSADIMCKVCKTAVIDSILLPCKHKATCIDCGSDINICPICGNRVAGVDT